MGFTRIITDGHKFKVQTRFLLIFWRTVQRPEDLDNKDFGGDMSFNSKKEAEQYISNKLTNKKWRVI